MAYLVSHNGFGDTPAGSLVMRDDLRAEGIAARLKANGATVVTVAKMTAEQHAAEKARRIAGTVR
jgi:hypothetical protein